jgi:hypothetical protein
MEFKKQISEYTEEINKFLDASIIIQNVPER